MKGSITLPLIQHLEKMVELLRTRFHGRRTRMRREKEAPSFMGSLLVQVCTLTEVCNAVSFKESRRSRYGTSADHYG